MGRLDGTANPSPADAAARDRILVTAPGAPPWPAGGSYVVVRRIRMLLDHWDTLPLEHREQAVGRRAADGSPLTGGTEHTAPDLAANRPDGVPVIAHDAHIRPAAPGANGGATMLRHGWSYYDGLRADGTPDAGMLFVAWQSDPRTGFVPVQRCLARGDALGRYLIHEASSLFVVPGGIRPGGYVGQPGPAGGPAHPSSHPSAHPGVRSGDVREPGGDGGRWCDHRKVISGIRLPMTSRGAVHEHGERPVHHRHGSAAGPFRRAG
ncbi:Dyp-type peroxidase [Streptomyces virginiae]|uniref:Dyp-type peroxidase n=1 Tax=Streptomyces virginiae TaxID=1961 RepID=UPI00372059C2